MSESDPAAKSAPDVRTARLSDDRLATNFADMHPTLAPAEALVEADRCYFCFDAPCTTACPTDIDIPGFIQGIRSDNRLGAARTILSSNIMGGMCARVCPTEVLCEEACVRHTHEDKPVEIGALQRYATEPVFDTGAALFERAPDTGKHVAVVGGGPAGLSCAHGLARLGHRVTIYDRADKLGGLNEYGIATYKTVNDFAQTEVDYILGIGNIEVRGGISIGQDIKLDALREQHDAVFIGVGLGAVNALRLPGEQLDGVLDAVNYIAGLRQAVDKKTLAVGRRIVVIGGGMTAIDIAVQSKLLGAEDVTIVYRRGPERMSASVHEQHVAQTRGVRIKYHLQPQRILGDGHVRGVEFEYTESGADGRLTGTGETCTLPADIVFKAIGQTLAWEDAEDDAGTLAIERGRIRVDAARRTSLTKVWAGGDCVTGGEDLTVAAVQDGKLAARDIHLSLSGG